MEKANKVRLHPTEYAQLEKELPTINPSTNSTPEQYAFWCGIQLVLKKLRDGFVIGEV